MLQFADRSVRDNSEKKSTISRQQVVSCRYVNWPYALYNQWAPIIVQINSGEVIHAARTCLSHQRVPVIGFLSADSLHLPICRSRLLSLQSKH